MPDPPVDDGAVHERATCALPEVALLSIGEPADVAGVTLFDAADATLVPIPFVAVTVNVYEVPFTRPVTVMGLPVDVAENPPELAVAVKYRIEDPPVEEAVKDMVAWALPPVAVPIIGALGTVAGVAVTMLLELALVPTAFTA